MHDQFELTPAQWATLRELLDEAMSQPDGDRDRWLDALTGEHAAFRARLEALVDHSRGSEAHAALQTLPKVETDHFAPLPPPVEHIGPYRLIRELGSGGMGSVWLAERTDLLHGRQVALKLPHGTWRRAGLADRLQREREILATLEHPNIARLYDAGVAGDGQPWLALEYVAGERIDAWCDRQGLPVPARLHLFLQVVRAVAHAHANLVVHRDLKPGNILVTGDGVVKLLDFGIAKLLEQGEAHETELTQQAGRALTPDYAAPEQILGRPIGTAADVYSLGVLLFELLAGTRPYTLDRHTRGALEDAILRVDPAAPSTRAPAARRAALRGDLDVITLKALRKSPAERYATVAALAEDIERHLSQRPVLAQPERGWYRFGKFVRRNRLAVGSASAVAVALLGGAALAGWQATQARAAQHQAEEARQLIESIFVAADPSGPAGRKLSAVELLRQAQARIGSLVGVGPAVRADLLNTLAASLLNLEDRAAAAQALQAAEAEARALPPEHRQTLRTERLRARLDTAEGRPADAMRRLQAVIKTLRAQGEAERPALLAALLDRTEAENAALDWPAAEASARATLALAEQLGANAERIGALLQLSHSHDRRNQPVPAHDAARQAHELALASFPGATAHPVVGQARSVYAAALWDMDEQDRAVDLMRESHRDAIAVFGRDSPIAAQQAARMAVYLTTTGYPKEALEAADDALRVLGPVFGTDTVAYASLIEARAAALLGLHRPAEALQEVDRARRIVVSHLGDEHEAAHILQAYRARSLLLLGKLDEAIAMLEATIERYRRSGYSTVAATTSLLGLAHRYAGRHEQSLALQQAAFAAVRQGPTARRWGSRVLIEIGLNRLALGDVAGARQPLRDAATIVQQKFRAPTALLANARLGLARIELHDGRPEAALGLLQAAEAYWHESDPQGRSAGEVAFWLGKAHAAMGRHAEARAAFERAAQWLQRSPFPVDALLAAQARQGAGDNAARRLS